MRERGEGYRAPPPPPYRRPWSLAGLLDHAASFLSVTLLGWWFSILLEWAGITWGWWALPGASHSEHLLRTELQWLQADFTTPETASRLLEWAYAGAGLLYRWCGLEWLVRWTVSDQPPLWPGLSQVRSTLRHLGDYVLAAAYITQLTGARLGVVVLALPAFATLGMMGAVDGLVRRDLRRFGGGQESSFMYHHLKKALRPMVSIPIFLYLISPWSVHPTWLFGPFAVLFGYFTQRTLGRFKKYL